MKFHTYQIPRLKELEMVQKSLADEFGKLRKEVDTYSSLFQMEGHAKNQLMLELKKEKETVESLVSILGRERRNIKDLKLEIKKLNELVMELVDENRKYTGKAD